MTENEHEAPATSRRSILSRALGVGTAAAVLGAALFAAPAQAWSDQTLNGWRFCAKCFSLFYDGYPAKGTCPAGGGHGAAGYNFAIPVHSC